MEAIFSPPVLTAGFACLGGQLAFSALFMVLPTGPWSRMPGFLGHQCVAFPLMFYMAYLGSAAFFTPSEAAVARSQTLDGRMHAEDPTGLLLSQIIVGMQLLWDIPTTILIKDLYSPLMLVHHVGMAVLAVVCLVSQFGQSYLPFFTGVVELSSIPLAIVDIFHPSKFGSYAEASACLGTLNLVCRLLFVLSFLAIRGLMFPFIALFRATPDLLSLLASGDDGWFAPALGLVIAAGFTGLQLHWGSLILKQLIKMVSGGQSKATRERRSSLQDMDLEELSGRRSFVEAPAEQL